MSHSLESVLSELLEESVLEKVHQQTTRNEALESDIPEDAYRDLLEVAAVQDYRGLAVDTPYQGPQQELEVKFEPSAGYELLYARPTMRVDLDSGDCAYVDCEPEERDTHIPYPEAFDSSQPRISSREFLDPASILY